jgi:hypothetical protein
MHFLRKYTLIITAALLPGLLFALALTYSSTSVIRDPNNIKTTVSGSGIYKDVVPAVLEQSEKNASNSDNNSISLNDPEVKLAASQTFDSGFMKQSSENIIDGVYHWLNGASPKPDFKIDVSAKKTQFANNVAAQAKQRTQHLPQCPLSVSPASIENTDIFKLKCLPYGITPAMVEHNLKQEVLSSQDFLDKPVITANTIQSNDSSKDIFNNQFKNVPVYYQKAKIAPIILALLIVLAIVAIVLLSPNHLHGVRRVSIILIISGVTVMIFAFVFNKVISDSIIPNVKLDNKPMQKDTQAIITSFTKNIDNKYWHFGEGYLALGAIVLAGTIYLSKRVKPHTTEAIDQKHTHQPLAKDS